MKGKEKAREFMDDLISDYVDELRELDRDDISGENLSHLMALVTMLDRIDGKAVPMPMPKPNIALIKK